jgi:intracellular multiplication protein IcmL
MANNALETVQLRKDFYRDNYRRCIGLLTLSIIMNFVLISVASYLFLHKTPPVYFATDDKGRVMPIQALSMPVVSSQALMAWANEAAVTAYTYNFVNYRQQLQDASEFFTPDGWKNFEIALESSRNLQTVISKKLVATAVATGAPVIEDQRVIAGKYVWKVGLPILVKYESASTNFNQTLYIRMIITRVSTVTYPKGIAISQFIASPG